MVIKKTIKTIKCVPVFGHRLTLCTVSRLGITGRDSRKKLVSVINNITTVAAITTTTTPMDIDCRVFIPRALKAEQRPIYAYRCLVAYIVTECLLLAEVERAVQLGLALPANIQSVRVDTPSLAGFWPIVRMV